MSTTPVGMTGLTTGQTYYARLIRVSDGRVLDRSDDTWKTVGVDTIVTGGTALSETPSGSGNYLATVPSDTINATESPDNFIQIITTALNPSGNAYSDMVSGTLTVTTIAPLWAIPGDNMGTVSSVIGNVGGNVVGSVASVTNPVTVGTNNDKSGYSISGTIQTLDALDTAQDSQHSTTQSAIAALNNLSSGDVVSATTSALNTYDPPTRTEATADKDEILAQGTTILNRLGSWTGSARNTILGAFQSLFRKDSDASVPSDINADLGSGAGTASNTTDSVEAIRDRGDAAWTTATGFAQPSDIPSAAANADAILDEALASHDTSGSLGYFLNRMAAESLGQLAITNNGNGTFTLEFTEAGGGDVKVTATCDANGNRQAVVLEG